LATWLAAGALGLAGGCSQTPVTSTQPHDPLHGNRTPPGLPPLTDSPKTPGTPTSYPNNSSNLAPITGSDLTAVNTATLAGMSALGRPMAADDQGRPLPVAQFTSSSKDTTPGYIPPNPTPKVEPVPDINPQPSKSAPGPWQAPQSAHPTVQPVSNSVPVNNPATTEAATRQLQAHGVVNQKIDQLADGIHLTCYVARPTGGLITLEVTATDYATAAQAIVQQLEAHR
jgi:hypothetical protein